MSDGVESPIDPDARIWDYIIVGGGTAGCVLAGRLSERASKRVLLIEAGSDTPPGATPDDILDPYPLSYSNPAYRWKLKGHALTAATSPATPLLQARVMGGGSSIMGMIMLRGVPADYDGWAAMGAVGWDWAGVLPFFRKLESDLDFGGELHGQSGLTEIRRHGKASWPRLAHAAGQFAADAGMGFIADMNANFADGYGALPIAGPATRRASSAISYLSADVRARPNLSIVSSATATDLIWRGGAVAGVVVKRQAGDTAFRARETILAMGALLTPYFLLKAGIGDPKHLTERGVTVRVGMSGVGLNLQNHAALVTIAHLRRGAVQAHPQRNHNNTMFRYSSGLPTCGDSDMAMVVATRVAWHHIAGRLAHFSPILMSPASRGEVSLPPSGEGPLIEYNLLGDDRDRTRLMNGLSRVAALAGSSAMKGLIGPVIAVSRMGNATRFNAPTRRNDVQTRVIATAMDWAPGIGGRIAAAMGSPLADILRDADRLKDHVSRNVLPLAHHAGTCRMGAKEDPFAVVDVAGRVHGVAGLRVADASVMPTVPRGNTNLPVLMIAEKLADAMLQDA